MEGFDTRFALAHVLGVDQDAGQYACHMPWAYETEAEAPFDLAADDIFAAPGIRLTGPDTRVLLDKDGVPAVTLHAFGKGRALYLGGFRYSPLSARMLLDALLYLTGNDGKAAGICREKTAECAWFPSSGKLVIFNNSSREIETAAAWPGGQGTFRLAPMETRIIDG